MRTISSARNRHAALVGVIALLLCPNATIALDVACSTDQQRCEPREDSPPLLRIAQASNEAQEQRVRDTLGRLERERRSQEERRNAEREQLERKARDAKENAERERQEHERKRTSERAEQQQRIEQYKEQLRSSPSVPK
jgi:hypothetical protein